MENLVVLIIASIFFIMGIMFLRVKWTFLIAGINTMSDSEREEYNIPNISKAMGKLMFLIAGLLIMMLLLERFRNIGGIIIGAVTVIAVIYINVSKKFKR